MTHLWAKIIKNEKILKQFVYKNENNFSDDEFHTYLMNICKELDLETPIILSKHLNNLKEFRSVKFFQDDFLDQIHFSYFLLEDISN